jgi:hypothetical protein
MFKRYSEWSGAQRLAASEQGEVRPAMIDGLRDSPAFSEGVQAAEEAIAMLRTGDAAPEEVHARLQRLLVGGRSDAVRGYCAALQCALIPKDGFEGDEQNGSL